MANQKVAFVTGCTKGGMGHAVCVELAKNGVQVFATARKVEAMGGLEEAGCTLLALDITDHKAVQAAVQQVIKKTGRIDILVNMAGVSGRGAAVEYDIQQARKQFEVNFFGMMAVIQAVAPQMMKQQTGVIINVGSALGLLPVPFASAYCATKAAVKAMTDIMRMELAGSGVNVVYAAPGWVKTNILDTMMATGLNCLDNKGPWAPCAKFITGNLFNVEGSHGWTPEQFAQDFVKMALSPNPPRLYLNSFRDGWLAWIAGALVPAAIMDKILSAKYLLGPYLFANNTAKVA
jgi:NAD(P)-dependent dehydrogenase (short-subunit alcohol dehydrogenase family)